MKKLYLINQYIVIIFNSLCFFNINIICVAALAAKYYINNTLEVSAFKDIMILSIRQSIPIILISLVYIFLNQLTNKKNMKKLSIALTIFGVILVLAWIYKILTNLGIL